MEIKLTKGITKAELLQVLETVPADARLIVNDPSGGFRYATQVTVAVVGDGLAGPWAVGGNPAATLGKFGIFIQ